MMKTVFELRDVHDGGITSDKSRMRVVVSPENHDLGILIQPQGTGTYDGPYAPIMLENMNGKPRLVVWADINDQEPTHIIDLSGAWEVNRAEEVEEFA